MGRNDLERLSKAELIELVLRLQQPAKTSRTSSKPPSTDRKAQRDKSRPGGAKPGHEGHSRRLSEDFDRAVDHYPHQCPGCQVALPTGLFAETVSEHDKIDLPPSAPFVERHRRLAVRCPSCGLRVVADRPAAAKWFAPSICNNAPQLCRMRCVLPGTDICGWRLPRISLSLKLERIGPRVCNCALALANESAEARSHAGAGIRISLYRWQGSWRSLRPKQLQCGRRRR
jgi:hypothetical protein